MSTNIKIAIDVMGSDNGPGSIISAASLSKIRLPNIYYTFFGDAKTIQSLTKKYNNLENSYEIIHTENIVLPEDKP